MLKCRLLIIGISILAASSADTDRKEYGAKRFSGMVDFAAFKPRLGRSSFMNSPESYNVNDIMDDDNLQAYIIDDLADAEFLKRNARMEGYQSFNFIKPRLGKRDFIYPEDNRISVDDLIFDDNAETKPGKLVNEKQFLFKKSRYNNAHLINKLLTKDSKLRYGKRMNAFDDSENSMINAVYPTYWFPLSRRR